MRRKTVRRLHGSRRRASVQKQSQAPAAEPHPLVSLQSSIGSHAVQRLINSSYIQTKLQVSSPDDEHEQEADHISDSVMRSADTHRASVSATQQSSPASVHKNESGGSTALPNDVRDFMEPRLGSDL